MMARRAGAMLGLLAFSVTVSGGLIAGNPVMHTLQRGLVALFLFSVLGFALGWAAHLVIREYERSREAEFEKRHQSSSGDTDVDAAGASEGVSDGELNGA